LLTSPRFEDIIDDLRDAFDYVLVDTPPLLAVSDPCIVATRMDSLLLTIRLSKNGRPAAERARDLIASLKVNCIGIVVNGVGKHGSMTGYGYEHYHYVDEYTTAYSTNEEVNSEPSQESPSRTEPTEDLSFAEDIPDEDPVSGTSVAIEPSANGHSVHT
jgi:succinoglycan biosynthesis transport protein ExoP